MLERQTKILVWTGVSPEEDKLDLQAVTTARAAEFVLVDKAVRDKAWMRKGRERYKETCLHLHMDGKQTGGDGVIKAKSTGHIIVINIL